MLKYFKNCLNSVEYLFRTFMTNSGGKIKHLLSHGIPSRSPVIKTFQNLLSFSPAKVCLLFMFGRRVFGSMLYVFLLSPPPCSGPKARSA